MERMSENFKYVWLAFSLRRPKYVAFALNRIVRIETAGTLALSQAGSLIFLSEISSYMVIIETSDGSRFSEGYLLNTPEPQPLISLTGPICRPLLTQPNQNAHR
jgi:hypothetical protein